MNRYPENERTEGDKHPWQAPELIKLNIEQTEGKTSPSPAEFFGSYAPS